MLADLRLALRALRRAPGLVAAAVLTIALGVAANAVAFAWFKGIALDPLPQVRDAGALVHLKTLELGNGVQNSISYPDYLDWRAQARAFDGMAVFGMDRLGVRVDIPDAATVTVWGNYASADFFTTLDVRPALGRFWRPDEATTPGSAPVVVLSDALWRRTFAADPGIIGRTLRVNGVPCTVIGIAPRGFAGAFVGLAFDVWVPITMWPRLGDWKDKLTQRESQWLTGIARPHAGVTLERINAELSAIGARVAAVAPESRGRRPLALAFAAARMLGAQLYVVSPADPVTFASAAALLLGVALTASWLPARRAARVDPTEALRAE